MRHRRLSLRSARPCLIAIVLLLAFSLFPWPVSGAQYGTEPSGNRSSAELNPVSLTLSGWGWHVGRARFGNVVLTLDGSEIPRDNTTNVSDLYMTGTFLFNTAETTDNFTVELRGSKVNSAFFLKQATGGSSPIIAEFEGVWFCCETPLYVACEGRLGVPVPGHVAEGYVCILRSHNIDTLVAPDKGHLARLALFFDEVADAVVALGTTVQMNIGKALDEMARVLLVWT